MNNTTVDFKSQWRREIHDFEQQVTYLKTEIENKLGVVKLLKSKDNSALIVTIDDSNLMGVLVSKLCSFDLLISQAEDHGEIARERFEAMIASA